METINERLENARLYLHRVIDESARHKFFMVEFWHIYRTTGFVLAREEHHLRLFNGDKMTFEELQNPCV